MRRTQHQGTGVTCRRNNKAWGEKDRLKCTGIINSKNTDEPEKGEETDKDRKWRVTQLYNLTKKPEPDVFLHKFFPLACRSPTQLTPPDGWQNPQMFNKVDQPKLRHNSYLQAPLFLTTFSYNQTLFWARTAFQRTSMLVAAQQSLLGNLWSSCKTSIKWVCVNVGVRVCKTDGGGGKKTRVRTSTVRVSLLFWGECTCRAAPVALYCSYRRTCSWFLGNRESPEPRRVFRVSALSPQL